MVGVVIAVVVVLIIMAAIAIGRSVARAADEAWQAAGNRLGLRYTPIQKRLFGSKEETNRHLRGTVDGRKVRVYTYTEGSGDSQTTYTAYQVGFPPLGLGLKIAPQGFWGKVKKAFGSQDIEVGDEQFDEAFLVKGDHPDQIAAFLTPSRRVTVSRLITEYRGATVGDDRIWWRHTRVQRDPDVIVSTVRRLAGAANALAKHRKPALDEVLEVQRQGDLGKAAAQVREATRGSTDLETERTAAEVLYAGGDLEGAAEAFDHLAEVLPVDDQVHAWRERIAARRAGGAPARAPSGESTDPGIVADQLFDPDNLSFETTRLFEDNYEGMRVRWTGTLVRATGYRSDLDFRNGPGTKAVFHVHDLGSSLYAGRDVEAVVQLPEGLVDDLRGRHGEEFTFTGTLDRIDAIMRNLYVRGGELTGQASREVR